MCIYREKTWSLQFSKISNSEPASVDVYIGGGGRLVWLT